MNQTTPITVTLSHFQTAAVAHFCALGASRATGARQDRWIAIRDIFAKADEAIVDKTASREVTVELHQAEALHMAILMQMRELEGDLFDLFVDVAKRFTVALCGDEETPAEANGPKADP